MISEQLLLLGTGVKVDLGVYKLSLGPVIPLLGLGEVNARLLDGVPEEPHVGRQHQIYLLKLLVDKIQFPRLRVSFLFPIIDCPDQHLFLFPVLFLNQFLLLLKSVQF